MSLIYSKHHLIVMLVCAMLLAACSSAPVEEEVPAQHAVSSSSSSKSESSSSSSSSAKAASASSSKSANSSASASSVMVPTASPPPVVIPPEAQSKFNKAMLQVYAGKIDDGAAQLEQLAAAYPTLSVPYINEGLMYLKVNQFEAAERAFKHAVERDATSAIANNYLGVAQRNLGKFKEAETAYQAAVAADDNYAAAHLNLGVLYDMYLQQPEQALQQYERYQQLLTTPDTKVASWIKELHARTGAGKKPPATETSAVEEGAKP